MLTDPECGSVECSCSNVMIVRLSPGRFVEVAAALATAVAPSSPASAKAGRKGRACLVSRPISRRRVLLDTSVDLLFEMSGK